MEELTILAVERTLAEIAFASDRLDEGVLADLVAADAVWSSRLVDRDTGATAIGLGDIVCGLGALSRCFPDGLRRLLTNTVVWGADGELVSATSYLTALTGLGSGGRIAVTGWYEDRFGEQGSRWVLERRQVVIDSYEPDLALCGDALYA
ncbi:MAG: hypothetical protein CL484_15500 [Acidobacteria bacterium]|nr:hypothetical protein [Acidobacteriota bacterium]